MPLLFVSWNGFYLKNKTPFSLPCLHMKRESQLPEWKYRNKNSRTLSLLLAPMLNYYFILVKSGSVFCFKCQPITLNELKTLCLSEIAKMAGGIEAALLLLFQKSIAPAWGRILFPQPLSVRFFHWICLDQGHVSKKDTCHLWIGASWDFHWLCYPLTLTSHV